jgi:hypothetical protein
MDIEVDGMVFSQVMQATPLVLLFFLVCYSVIGGQRWSCFAGRLYLVIAASILACISLGISWLAHYVVPF